MKWPAICENVNTSNNKPL